MINSSNNRKQVDVCAQIRAVQRSRALQSGAIWTKPTMVQEKNNKYNRARVKREYRRML